MFRKFKLKSNGLNKSMPSLNFDNNDVDAPTTKNAAALGFRNVDDDDMSLIEGIVHLKIILPNGTSLETDVDAKTPMMDLLVQVTTSNGIAPGGLYLKVPSDRPPGYIHYKPNEPVGKLNCNLLEIVPKFDLCERPKKHMPKTANQPFDPTIRIQVDLPKNQKTFLRVNPNLTLREVFLKICNETKNNSQSYELRSTKRLDSHLDLNLKLSDVGTVDFSLIPSRNVNFRKSINDVYDLSNKMPVEQSAAKSKGIFGCFNKKHKKQTTDSTAGTRMSVYEVPNGKTPTTPPTNGQGDGTAADEKSLSSSSNRPKKRSAPKPPEEIVQLNGSHGKMHHAPLSAFAVDQNNSQQTTKENKSQRIRQNSDSSSGYHDGGSSMNSPSPEAGCSTRTTTGDSVVDTALSEKSTSSGDASLSGSATVRSPTTTSTPPAQKNVTAIVRSSRAVSDTSETSVGGTKKKRAPPPPRSPPSTKNIIEKIQYSNASPIVLRNDTPSSDGVKKSKDTRRKSSTPSDLDEIIERHSSPKHNGVTTINENNNASRRSADVSVFNESPLKSVSSLNNSLSPKKMNDTYSPKKIINGDLNVEVESNVDVPSVNDGRKSWLHLSPTSPVHTVEVNEQNHFIESTGPSPPPEENEIPMAYVEPANEPPPPPILSSTSAAPQSSPQSRLLNKYQLNDPKRDSYPSSMAVKSFEDEYYSKKVNKDLRREAENGEFVAAANRQSSGDVTNVRPTAASSTTTRPESKMFSVETGKIENPALQKEYEKLQVLFTEWQNRLNRNEAIIKKGEKLSSDEIVEFQKMQSVMMEQHKLVQKLCAESDSDSTSSNVVPSTKSDKIGLSSTENRNKTTTTTIKMSPTPNVKTNERRTPSTSTNVQHQKQQFQVDDRNRNLSNGRRETSSGVERNGRGYDESAVDTSSLVRPTQLFGAVKSTTNGNFIATDQRPTVGGYRAEPMNVAPSSKSIKSTQAETKFVKNITIPTTVNDSRFDASSQKTIVVDTSMPQLWTPTTKQIVEPVFRNVSPVATTRESNHSSPPMKKPMTNGNSHTIERTTTNGISHTPERTATLNRENFMEKSSPTSAIKAKSTTIGAAPPPPPPPPPPPSVPPLLAEMMNVKLKPSSTLERRSTNVPPPSTNADPKDELMRAIRGFGGSGGLKKVTSVPSQFRITTS